MRRWLGLGLVLLVLVGGWLVGWAFASRNGAPVSVDLLTGEAFEAPLWRALLGAFAAGAALAALVAGLQVARLGLLARRYRKAVTRLESELHQLRNLPLAAEDEEAPAPLPEAAGAGGRDG